LTFLLFIFYSVLFCWLITRIRFFKESGLSVRFLITLFLLRILVLIINCYVNLYYLPVSDSVILNGMGIDEFHLLFQNPHEYLVNIFHTNSPDAYSRLLDDSHSFWNNLRTNLILKMLSIFNFFSFKSFLINTLFFNFLVFFGFVALYKVFIKIFPASFYQLIICIFLLPSAFYFSSEIHRDGLILLSLSMIIYHLFFILNYHQFSWKRIWTITAFLLLIFLLRNFVFITLIPALIAWILSKKFSKHVFICFVIVYLFSTILFFCSGFISDRGNLPQYVTARQQSFVEIGKMGASTINIHPLYPNFKSFLMNAPEALNHALMRPYLSKTGSAQYIPFALEVFIIEILFFIFIFFRKNNIPPDPLIYFGIFFSLSMLLITGYTVPIIGAIVRYRSIYLIFLLIPVVCYTDWKKFARWFLSRNKNYIESQ
jgi:hypothetical protein